MQCVSESLTRTYPAQAESVAQARKAMTEFARRSGASETTVDAIRLATSEAVTNAVLHAYGGEPGQVHLTAARAGTELWLFVADDGVGLQPGTKRSGLGLGLGLISQVCDEMAIVPRTGGGTEVRIRFALSVRATPEHLARTPALR